METKEPCRWNSPAVLWSISLFFILVMLIIQPAPTNFIPEKFHLSSYEPSLQDALKGYLIKTPGCQIPALKTFSRHIKRFIHRPKKPNCNQGIPPLFASNRSAIFKLNSSVASYADDPDELKCCFQAFWRQQPEDSEKDTKTVFETTCTPVEDEARIEEEFIRVECQVNASIVYKDFFSFVPIKTTYDRRNKTNVLIIGLDAVSRLNFHRQMPRTAELLRKLSAVELLGYNKVGDNTFPNIIPVLTGLSEKQLRETCWNEEHKNRFDDCPFLWKDFKAEGYVTSFGEDSSWMGIFNYLRKGFKRQPTDYMWGVFDYISQRQIGNAHNMNVNQCIGAREVYKVFLRHIRDFVDAMDSASLPYFAFYWGATLSHDHLNQPSLGDNTYFDLFEHLHSGGHLDNTILVFMSDHGLRWGDMRQTYQGQMEERLPFLYIVLPEWYKRRHERAHRNLMVNVGRLTTPYDLHETLKDVLAHRLKSNSSKGVSLFSEISKMRTCEQAHISSHWCTCQQSEEVETNNTRVTDSAMFAVSYINGRLEGFAECAKLHLVRVKDARMMLNNDVLHRNDMEDYMVMFETEPGNAVFEATVRYSVEEESFGIVGTVSRLNLYGRQSGCISDFHLKLFCYCKN